MSDRHLSEFVSVRGRFHRSVNLLRDWELRADLTDYRVTPSIRQLAEQILDGLREPAGNRAWSITGPYGSGKSAFALFLADVIGSRKPTNSIGQSLRDESGISAEPFMPVLFAAERGPLIDALRARIAEELEQISQEAAQELSDFATEAVGSGDLVSRLLQKAAHVAQDCGYGGLLVVIDELGKYLEFAAAEPDQGDVFFLQQLAEMASRSEVPILFVTILHTGFADYLALGDEVRRAEWQKVQGRFRDVAFQLPAEQMLKLVGDAIMAEPEADLDATWRREIDNLLVSRALKEAGARLPLQELLHECLPLHPLTSLLLWPLFRSKGAQNERSLFAFLTSTEPLGFQSFLHDAGDSAAPLYRVADLYDYVSGTLGLATYRGDHARKWSLVEHALSRIPKENQDACGAVVKTIGLLGIYGQAVGLKPSRELLGLAFPEEPELEQALKFLEERSIVLYRRHADAYGLWEGSDFDLESALEEARRQIGDFDLASRLRRYLGLRPIVARAHYIEKGTLRFFDVEVVPGDRRSLEEALRQSTDSDGKIIFAIPSTSAQADEVVDVSKELTREGPADLSIVAVPQVSQGLGAALHEVESWTWVRDNSPQLQGDSVARTEVRARLAGASERLERTAGRIFGSGGSPFEPERCTWLHNGEVRDLVGPRSFQRFLSETCDAAFYKAPELHNELLNRIQLSSAAARARRNLLELMAKQPDMERLGIEGTPAEASMYESMLRGGGFHRRKGKWQIGAPTLAWRPAWQAAMSFVRSTQQMRRPLTDLMNLLKAPPYGIREGPLMVFLWALLLSKKEELGLYEEGVFVPDLRVEVAELLVRRPETFEIQSYRLTIDQKKALRSLLSVVEVGSPGEAQADAEDFLPLVRALVLFASQLTPYAQRTTRLSTPEAAPVRNALLEARDPHELLFQELPAAMGLDLELPSASEALPIKLRKSLRALSRAYPDLLDDIEQQVRSTFSLSGSATEARGQLAARARPLVDFAVQQPLQLFVRQVAGPRGDQDWRETIGRVVGDGLPPSHWRDRDVSAFQVRLQEVASEFVRLEELVAEKQSSGATTVFRIGVLDGQHEEWRAVVPFASDDESELADLTSRLESVLSAPRTNGETDLRLAALARVATGLLSKDGQV